MHQTLKGQLDVSFFYSPYFFLEKPKTDWTYKEVPELFWKAWEKTKIQQTEKCHERLQRCPRRQADFQRQRWT